MADPANQQELAPNTFRHGTGLRPSPSDVPSYNHALLADLAVVYQHSISAPPPRTDDRRGSWIEVWDQGKYGACVAFNVAALVYRAVFTASEQQRLVFNPSRLWIYYQERIVDVMERFHTTTKPGDEWWQDEGGVMVWTLMQMERSGFAREDQYPYNLAFNVFDSNGPHTAPPVGIQHEALPDHHFKWTRIDSKFADYRPTMQQLKALVNHDIPITFAFVVWPNLHRMYGSKTQVSYSPNEIERVEIDKKLKPAQHQMSIVGYTIHHGYDCAIVRNSWGAGWGDGGYCYWPWDLMLLGKIDEPVNGSYYRCNEWFVVQVDKKGLDGKSASHERGLMQLHPPTEGLYA